MVPSEFRHTSNFHFQFLSHKRAFFNYSIITVGQHLVASEATKQRVWEPVCIGIIGAPGNDRAPNPASDKLTTFRVR
jgi:hypothetical protein